MTVENPVVPTSLKLARHIVGLFVFMGALDAYFHNFGMSADSVKWWLIWCVAVIGMSAIILGAWALFLTARSKGHAYGNYMRLQWTLGVLSMLGVWSGTVVGNTLMVLVSVLAMATIAVHLFKTL